MNHHFDLLAVNSKQPVRFDDFEPFVHHGGGIDGDAVAHPPVGMRQSLFRSDVGELLERCLSKRATRRGEHKTPNFAMRSAAQTLVQRVVLAVHGKKFAPRLPCDGHHQLARCDENLFVRKSDGLSKLHGLIGCFQSDDTDRCGDDNFGLRMRANGKHSLAAMMNFRLARDTFLVE